MKTFCTLFVFFFLVCSSNTQAQTVYITKTGEKYHKDSCRHLKYSKREITLQQALEAGYQACLVCKPPKVATQETTQNTGLGIIPKSTKSKSITDKPKSTATDKSKPTIASQCTGKTKAGSRCKRMTKSANGRCYQH